MRRLATALLLAPLLAACPKKPNPPPEPSGRCEVDLEALGLFSQVGGGASARAIEGDGDLIGGPHSDGKVGDTLLENDRIRVVIQAPGREISATPYGGNIIDADLRRPAGAAGKSSFGEVETLYAFGRTLDISTVEILKDGSGGGMAVVAATGTDTAMDYVNLPSLIDQYVPGAVFPVDPNAPLPLLATTYYVLSPGESRVRILTAFCNSGTENVVVGVGDLVESGGVGAVFNPAGCSGTLGSKGCFIDSAPWFGHQYDGMAYGLRPYKFTDLATAETSNALLFVAGISGLLAGGEGQSGLLSWLDTTATRRAGAFGILAGQQRNYLRDFVVAKDLAEVQAHFLLYDSAARARLNVAVTLPDGTSPAPFARVAIVSVQTGKQVALMVADAAGKAKTDLPPGGYTVQAGEIGRALENPTGVTVPSSGEVSAAVRLGARRTLTVTVKDPFDRPLTAKVMVSCPSDPCPFTAKSYRLFHDVNDQPSDVAAIGYVPPQGTLQLPLPPGQYQVRVLRGPEYSMWPDTAPAAGASVDLASADASLTATLAQVVDSTGWMSADLHVHAVNSPDSDVPNAERALSFAAEGVDVLVSTDHDFVTDYAPVVRALGAESQLATLIGCEVTPFDYGHQNAYPVVRKDGFNGGALDWAGGAGPSLRLEQIYSGLRADHPNVVLQMNHPRGPGGSLTQLQVDTATSASHAPPEKFRMEPAPGATALDTRLFSNDFDAFEVMNGTAPSLAVMNDWMTFLSRGQIKTATGVSDTHHTRAVVGGYGRTWVKLGVDTPAQFGPDAFATALKARRAIAGNGPFVQVTAQPLGSGGAPVRAAVGIGDTVGVNPGAGEQLELTVDVQAPEWLTFDSIEVYTHTTGREALNGEANGAWPDSRVHQKATLDPAALPVEAVPGLAGFAARRLHVTRKFTVTPTADTWYVVFVRGATGGSASIYPLGWDGVACSGSTGLCTPQSSRAWAFTNPIFVDADGSGAYDTFPLKQGLSAYRPPAAPAKHFLTSGELLVLLGKLRALAAE